MKLFLFRRNSEGIREFVINPKSRKKSRKAEDKEKIKSDDVSPGGQDTRSAVNNQGSMNRTGKQ